MAQPEPFPLSLDEQLCFALYAASRAMTSCYRPLLEPLGLTYPQYLVLLVLWERGELTVGGLGQALQLETGTLSPLLKRLEAAGLVRRVRQSDDERSVRVVLTPAGTELRGRAPEVYRGIEEAVGLARPELAALRDTLDGLARRLRSPAHSI